MTGTDCCTHEFNTHTHLHRRKALAVDRLQAHLLVLQELYLAARMLLVKLLASLQDPSALTHTVQVETRHTRT